MTSRADLLRLADAGRGAVGFAQDELLAFMSSLDLDDRAALQTALHEFLPALIAQYGDMAATAAAEWYEGARASQIGGEYYARLGSSAPLPQVHSSVGYAATAADPSLVAPRLLSSVQRLVTFSQRSTVGLNAGLDRARPLYARVPTGQKTCAWCVMLASRGFDYASKKSAGDGGRGFGDDYHDDCNCQVVAEWSDEPSIEGYDPARYDGMYRAARANVEGQPTPAAITSMMREMFPGEFTDGHVHN